MAVAFEVEILVNRQQFVGRESILQRPEHCDSGVPDDSAGERRLQIRLF
jgi:hypothetical protein